MKALNLRSMSRIMALAMMFIVSFTSCSDNEEGSVPVFPELKEINCDANETAEISFEANLDWEISSNAGWCKFINGEFSEGAMNGKAGKQTLTISVSADGQNYNDDATADITLKMTNLSQVIYKVKRAKREYADLLVTDEEGNKYDKTHPLTIKGNGNSTVYTIVKAQAEAGMEIGFYAPAWLDFTVDEEGTYRFTFKYNNSEGLNPKYPIEEGEHHIVFMTKDAETANTDKIRKVEIPLIYEGMQEDAIIIDPAYTSVAVSANGQTISDGETTSSELTSTITVRGDEFKVVAFARTDKGSEEYEYDFSGNGNVDWINITTDNDKVTLKAEENNDGKEREGVVMAFPIAVYNTIQNDLQAKIIDSETNEIYTQYNTNIVAVLKQDKKKEKADRITFGVDYYYMPEPEDPTAIAIKSLSANKDELSLPVLKDLKDEAGIVEYGVVNNNVWKITIPKAEAAAYLYRDDTHCMLLLIEGIGMADGQEVVARESNTCVNGRTITGSVVEGAGFDAKPRNITAFGLYFVDAERYDNSYQLVVKGVDEDGNEVIDALCIIEIAEE
ncbi:BACON domain-containing protein [Bacteroides eggerthii]|uniref:BACON domain-containing protein n=1 Tax=Bacteroides eggerthii TaxID=28111 RepID=UPI00356A7947